MKINKLIIVSAEWDPLHKKMIKIAQKVSEEFGLDIEELKEDWVFLSKHGEKDELGGADIPQLFVETEKGEIIHIITKIPINEKGMLDDEKALEIIREKIRSLLREKA